MQMEIDESRTSNQLVKDEQLFEAAESGDDSLFKSLSEEHLLKTLSLRNEDGHSLLHVAVSFGHVEVVKILSAADPSVSDVNSADEEGWTPLLSAASSGNVEILEILLKRGANVNMVDKGGRSALHYAASKGWTEIAKILISHGAKLNLKDKFGCTPLHGAANTGSSELCELLIEEGAEIDDVDKAGQTPLMNAFICHNKEINKMGVKRPFDVKEFQEQTPKQVKHLDFQNLASGKETWTSHETHQRDSVSGERKSNIFTYQSDEKSGRDNHQAVSGSAVMEFDMFAPLSRVTSSEANFMSREAHFSFFPEYFNFNLPRRSYCQSEDSLSILLNRSPRKDIPIGPDNQADVPKWDPNANIDKLRLMGTCVIPILTSVANSSVIEVGCGRRDCDCSDKGSVRCVRQHIHENQEKLRNEIGDEKFKDLGFLEMGEEISSKWTAEEERLFHEVIYSNPVSLGMNFWKQLEIVFPTRPKREIVSYYFNVFVLRRRAVQNRSKLLEIDSDNDVWQGDVSGFNRIEEGDEDSSVESFDKEDVQYRCQDDFPCEDDDSHDYNGEDDDYSDDGYSDDDLGVGEGYATKKDDRRNFESDRQVCNSDNTRSADFDVHGDSTSSSETQPSSVCVGTAIHTITLKSAPKRYFGGNNNCLSDELESASILGSCDANVWSDVYPTGLTKTDDLLPTSNLIEEIFGPSTWDGVSG